MGYIVINNGKITKFSTSVLPLSADDILIEVDINSMVFENGYEYTYVNGQIISNKSFELSLSEWKNTREVSVANLEVTYNGIVYQGDETSQDRMSRTINGLPDEVSAVPWVAKDNSIQYLTKLDLQQILYLAVQEQSRLWSEGRPLLKE